MYRTASTTRVSDEYHIGAGQVAGSRSVSGHDHLPMYDPQLEIGKKETARLRVAENMVHLIPVVIIICAMVLWIFSNPEIEMASYDDSILVRIKNMTIDGYINWNGTTLTIGKGGLDPIEGIGIEESGRDLDDDKNQV